MNLFSFKGRAHRAEYWGINLPIAIIARSSASIPDDAYDNLGVCLIIILLSVLILWICIATNTRRCHDLGHNGFWQFIPFYGIWMAFVAGQEGKNEYDLNPSNETA